MNDDPNQGEVKRVKYFLPPDCNPGRTAVMLAITYGALALAYIFVSSHLAAVLAVSKLQLTEIEFWKGVAFVVATSAVVFFLAFAILRRVADRERELDHNRQALVVAERRALSGIFAAAIAHDINNTLSVFHGGLDELVSSGGTSEPVRHMQVALDGLQKMTAQLLQASRDNGYTELTACDLASIVRDAVSFGRIHSRIRYCHIEEKIPAEAACHAHPPLLRQMILNLLLNAAEATGGKGRILVALASESAGGYSLSVSDDGPGVPSEYRERLFHPFFTTKQHGTGLGLLSVKAAAQAHGGSVEYATSNLGGACFRVLFPTRFKD